VAALFVGCTATFIACIANGSRNVWVIVPDAIDAAEEVRRLPHEAISKRTQLDATEFLEFVIKAHNTR
jgi:hypothetical protein